METMKILDGGLFDMDSSILFDEEEALPVHAESAGDALIYSLNNKGKVDIEYMSKISNIEMGVLIESLKGAIYQNPLKWNECYYKGFETADEYLSGNVLEKFKAAAIANKKYNGLFDINIEAIKTIAPKGIGYNDIYFSLASPWLPKELIYEFIKHLYRVDYFGLNHDTIIGKWEISIYNYPKEMKTDIAYGTRKISVRKILEHILNSKSIAIYNYFDTGEKKYKKLDVESTLEANEKAKVLEAKFKNYINSNETLRKELVKAYNEKFGYQISRHYNGSFLTFPNINKDVNLFDYQKNAIARIIFNRNTLLAHNVGAGKTYEMIASAQEMLRMGLTKKNLFIVPNSIVGQWSDDFKYLYPNSSVWVLTAKDFVPAKKRSTLEKIRDSQIENIVMPYSIFDAVDIDNKIIIAGLNNQLSEINQAIQKHNTTYALHRYRKKILAEIDKLTAEVQTDNDITLDKLGFTRLYVDEAHNYKNIAISSTNEVRGISSTPSKKCLHLLNYCDYLNSESNTGIIFATGTPITNSITDCYAMQRYLQYGELRVLDIKGFDSWATMYAESADNVEIDVDTSKFRVIKRYTKFHNLPELSIIFSHIADFYYNKDDNIPNSSEYQTIKIKKDIDLNNYLMELTKRVETIRTGSVTTDKDNMLKVTTDGRKAALDLRIIDPDFYKFSQGKVYTASNVIYDVYKKTKDFKGTQLVFCDISTPKDDFNVYDELKRLLVQKGIPSDEIYFIQDATPAKRKTIVNKVNRGDIRILFGSTPTLGTGVNVQERLYAIHHLDVPWRPADMVQREGRILRQGNTNNEVYIYRYVTEGSFDAYSWQLLETKQQFINELLNNSITERNKEDIEDTVLSYGEVKALAIGNPELKKHADLKNQYNKLLTLEKRQKEKYEAMGRELYSIPSELKELKVKKQNIVLDSAMYGMNKKEYTKEERQTIRSLCYSMLNDNIDSPEEIYIARYQGFELYVPAHLVANKLFLNIKLSGTYSIEIGNSELGVLTRIDNFLNSFDTLKKDIEDKINKLNVRQDAIKEELANKTNYKEEIESLNLQIKKLEENLK